MYHGGYSQFAKVKKEFLVKKPKNLSTKESMIMGTAGFTALLCAFAVNAREELLLGEKVNDVLVTGATGGVGSVAVMALSKMGYNVTAVTGKPDNADLLKKLGAKNIVNRSEFEGETKLLEKQFGMVLLIQLEEMSSLTLYLKLNILVLLPLVVMQVE